MNGFAPAAQLPPEGTAILQRCFNNWNNIMDLADSWFIRNRREVQNPEVTARLALFPTLAEAWEWRPAH